MPYIYLIHPRQFQDLKKNIYKPGHSTQKKGRRLGQYQRGKKILLEKLVNNSIKLEKIILKVFKEKFIHRLDYGREYFEGDANEMLEIMNEIIQNNDDTEPNYGNETLVNEGALFCELCKYVTDKKTHYIKHLETEKHKFKVKIGFVPKIEIEKKPMICEYCTLTFINDKSFAIHVKTCLKNPSNKQCAYCKMIYHKETAFASHVEMCLTNKILELQNIITELKIKYKNRITELETSIETLQISNNLNNQIKQIYIKNSNNPKIIIIKK